MSVSDFFFPHDSEASISDSLTEEHAVTLTQSLIKTHEYFYTSHGNILFLVFLSSPHERICLIQYAVNANAKWMKTKWSGKRCCGYKPTGCECDVRVASFNGDKNITSFNTVGEGNK